MLVIRMQRTGRKGHAQFRVVVQDSRRTPTSGKIVASLGHFNPHTKETSLDKEKASFYLEHGAQPSERVIRLLKQEGIKMPDWVSVSAENKSKSIRHSDKLRKNRPAEVIEPSPEVEAPAEPEEQAPETDEKEAVAKAEEEPEAAVEKAADEPEADEAVAETEEKSEAGDEEKPSK